jgi:dihydroxy-acid dehydratase
VSDDEMARRRAAWTPLPPRYERGYGRMYQEHIGQADDGCDFDFLARPGHVPEPEIH